MEVVKTLKPGSNGTKRLVDIYGESLVAVRYRLDREKQLSYTTVELIIEHKPILAPTLNTAAARLHQERQRVAVRIRYAETELQSLVKKAGGKWDPDNRVWLIRYGDAIRLGLKERIVQE
ncbi:hypothetical protein A9179_10845 [Pseudomonas alcaligenes]|uniref:Uncharacterized protein n=1 Tax=Aquipseudomonas alcaligenes TaxID=43263 RepID=A0ABR7S145_AQUAC|nr:hypothetical protein [Pseudomonas alcaligenes]MBC9250774.1 hypothetical protein [Pseudomonas alcaligenes]